MYYPAASTSQEFEGASLRSAPKTECPLWLRLALWQAVFPPACCNLRHRLRAARREGEGGGTVAGSCQEQTSGLRPLQLFDHERISGVGCVERGHRPP